MAGTTMSPELSTVTGKRKGRSLLGLRPGSLPAPIPTLDSRPAEAPPQEVSRSEPAETLRKLARGFKLSFRWIPGMEQTLSGQEKEEWLNSDLTEKQRSAASVKKQLYPKHPALTQLNSARTQVKSWFLSKTNPFPERGIRIYLVDSLDVEGKSSEELEREEAEQVATFRRQLQEQIDTIFSPAVQTLSRQWSDVLEGAQVMLADKYDPGDYVTADKLAECVRCWFEPVNLDLSREWKYLSPGERERELNLIRQKYELAVQKQEEFVVSLLQSSLADLHESLTGVNTGQKRTIYESTVDKIYGAVNEFRQKTVRYGILKDSAVESIVRQVDRLIHANGYDSRELTRDLRDRDSVRAKFTQQVASIKEDLSTLVQSGQVRRKLSSSL